MIALDAEHAAVVVFRSFEVVGNLRISVRSDLRQRHTPPRQLTGVLKRIIDSGSNAVARQNEGETIMKAWSPAPPEELVL